MRISKIHIENFGKLHNFDLNFDDNLVQIYNKNGWGKTTLSIFIKAMFYGMPAKSRGDDFKYERTKYQPWQGGNYGGYIEFENNGTLYRVTRFFAKTPEDDFYELLNLKTNKRENLEKIPLGEQLFNLGVESFVMTAFFPQLDFKSSSNAAISASLTGVNKYKDDLDKIQGALKRLKDRKNLIKRQMVKSDEIENNKSQMNNVSALLTKTNFEISRLNDEKTMQEKSMLQLKDNYDLQKQKFDYQSLIYSQKEKANEKLLASNEKLKSLNEKYIKLTQDKPKNIKSRKSAIQFLPYLSALVMVTFIILSALNILSWLVGGIIALVFLLSTVLLFVYDKKYSKKDDQGDVKKELADLLEDIEREKRENEELKQTLENQFAEVLLPNHADLDSLLSQIKDEEIKLNNLANSIKLQYQTRDDFIEKLDYLQTTINSLTQRKDEDNKKNQLIQKTIEYLELAQENVSQRFVDPVNQDFKKIFDRFNLQDKEFLIDNNLNINEKSPVGLKNLEYSSQGIQDIISFTKRLILIDKIYAVNKPVIVLDDTFVNLDDNMLELAKKIVKSLSEKYQVFYFCCNSRCQIIKTM